MDASTRLVALIAAVYGLLFAVAVIGKADNWRSWSRAMRGFLPGRPAIAAVAVVAVPVVEAVVAGTTFFFPKLGLVAAGAVLVLFAAVVAVLQTRHRGEECNCFGALATSRISPALVGRNAIAAAVALAVGVASWRLEVPRLAATHFLVLILVGSLLVIAVEFRNFLRVREREVSG